jgi:hypothetical protein
MQNPGQRPLPLNPRQTYVHLSEDGLATTLPGGDAFWGLPDSEIESYGSGWLVAEFEFTADWPNWEMHPGGDEIVYLLQGALEIHLEQEAGLSKIALSGSGVLIIPQGIWHTAKVHAPSRMLHITRGAGTQTRPV